MLTASHRIQPYNPTKIQPEWGEEWGEGERRYTFLWLMNLQTNTNEKNKHEDKMKTRTGVKMETRMGVRMETGANEQIWHARRPRRPRHQDSISNIQYPMFNIQRSSFSRRPRHQPPSTPPPRRPRRPVDPIISVRTSRFAVPYTPTVGAIGMSI